MKKRLLAALLAVVMVFTMIPTVFAATQFVDVKTGAWYADAVEYVSEAGLMSGTGGGKFSPSMTTDRGMIVSILWRMAGYPIAAGEQFSDVAEGAYYANAVLWAANAGIASGYNGKFSPTTKITLEQLAQFLFMYAQHEGMNAVTLEENLGQYADANQISTYAVTAMNWAVGQGLITGNGAGLLAPKDETSRAQLAVILMNFCELLDGAADVEAEEYTVTFEWNYGSKGEYDSKSVESGDTVRKPRDPERKGYEFLGWYTKESGGKKFDFDTEITEDISLYARWAKEDSGHSHSYKNWTYNGDGTHTGTCRCGKTRTLDCSTEWVSNNDGTHTALCEICEAVFETADCKVAYPEDLLCEDCGFEITVEEDVIYYGTILYGVTDNFNATSLNVKEGTTEIRAYALNAETQLTNVILPDSVIKIGDRAFENCTALTSINLPEGLEDIGERAFKKCPVNTTLPSTLKNVGEAAFQGTALTSVTIYKDTVYAGSTSYGAFEACSELTSVTIEDGVTYIPGSMFKSCFALSSVTIPASVTKIGARAFYDCSALETVEILGSDITFEVYSGTKTQCFDRNANSATMVEQTIYVPTAEMKTFLENDIGGNGAKKTTVVYAVAQIGDKYYGSLADAFEAANVVDQAEIVVFETGDTPLPTNVKIEGGKNITLRGATGKAADVKLNGQIATTSSTAGTLTIKDVTIQVDDAIVDSTGISQTQKSAIAVWGNQTVNCENVIFEMSLQDSTAISGWWDTGVGTTINVEDCVFNCNGQRPLRSCGNMTVENCQFNDPYRYAVQLTAKANTATELENAVVTFKNNTITNGENGKNFVYGIQLEGGSYGCNDLIINGSGNTIKAGEWDTNNESTMYYCECGKVEHSSIVWSTEEPAVHEDETYVPGALLNGVEYDSLAVALTEAEDGDTIILAKDETFSSQLKLENDVVIDLNEKEIEISFGWAGILSTKDTTIKNGTVTYTGGVGAIQMKGGNIENVIINVTPNGTNKNLTGICVREGESVGYIKDVTITGVTQGIEVLKGAHVDLIENANVNAVSNGDKPGTALVINAGNVDVAKNCEFDGDVYGVNMHLNGEYQVALTLENCKISGGTKGIWAHDEPNISNTTNCSLTLTYDSATTIEGDLNWDFEDECKSVVTLNAPSAN